MKTAANISVERMAAGGARLQIRALGTRRIAHLAVRSEMNGKRQWKASNHSLAWSEWKLSPTCSVHAFWVARSGFSLLTASDPAPFHAS